MRTGANDARISFYWNTQRKSWTVQASLAAGPVKHGTCVINSTVELDDVALALLVKVIEGEIRSWLF
uniref:Uncharacterized protein n=1 Tax=uncultured prokaryote TaxID=198431 RepID=A0A0H5Q7I8_9ZZZZ|nr:hypothetical protein [uncultured prokaryote]